MPSEADILIIEVLRTAGRPLSVPEIRKLLRGQGRVLSEEFIERACRSAEGIRAAGNGCFGLLSQLIAEASRVPVEPESSPSPVTLTYLPVLRSGSYVVFDLETTGTDPDTDAIIQIGALRVEGGTVADIFFAPVNPGNRRIDPVLRRKLAIPEGGEMDRMILDAPTINAVLPLFRRFVGDELLVAHNGLGLDLPFLVSAGFPADHPLLDSIELAFVAMPEAERFTLEALAEDSGLPPGAPAVLEITSAEARVAGAGHHNALYDAAVLHLIVRRLLATLDGAVLDGSLYGRVLATLTPEIAPRSHSSDLLNELRAGLTPTSFPTARRDVGRGDPPDPARLEDEFRTYIAESGQEPRASQTEMVRLVSDTLREGGARLIEAPTGTGKSLGLAYPAARHALATGERVLLSTYTRNLQDQLERDIERLSVAGNLPFRWCVLKGRGNYLCVTALLERLRDEIDPHSPTRGRLDERLCLAIAIGWGLQQASAGLEGELDGFSFAIRRRFPAMGRLLDAVRGARNRCRDDRCAPTHGCYRGQARARALAADLLLVNHALWLSPALDKFPPFAGLLLDEAHELEDAATSALQEEVTDASVADLLGEILAPGDRRGVLPRLLARASGDADVSKRTRGGIAAVRQARADSSAFGRDLAGFLRRVGIDPAGPHGALLRLRGDGARQYPARWRALERAATALSDSLGELEAALAAVAGASENHNETQAFHAEVSFLAEQVAGVRRILGDALRARDRRWVAWVEATVDSATEADSPDVKAWAVRRAPIRVAEALRQRFDVARGVVLTSATLTIKGGDFGFLLDRLGLESTASDRLHRLAGAFDYRNALLVMPRYLDYAPQGATLPFFVREMGDELRTLFTFTEGRGLVLFTARTRMAEVTAAITDPLSRVGVTVFSQQHGANRDELRGAFSTDEHSVLLGVRSFWQGVDVPGSACSLVVIEKLPFPAFGEPIVEARREAVAAAGRAEFEDYLLPLALLLFKQGFGRLLRASDDRGAVLFMDRRVHSRSYKADLLNTLPGYTRHPEVEDSRRESYRTIAEHLPELFAGRDLAALLAGLPDALLSEIGALVAAWNLPPALSDDEYAERRTEILGFMERIFGFVGFRGAEQEAIIRAILTGRDVIGLLPTGAGKSLTFQLPALLRRGLTLVLSPLIALMKDQVEKLHALRLDMVDAITSHSSAGEREDTLRRARAGRLRLLYVSPERLRDAQLQATLRECEVVHVVVDEAHCVSMWGPTFRPDYVGIAPALASLPTRPPTAALTATATPEIQADIEQRLALRDPLVVRGSFDRPEIRYLVYSRESRVHPIRSANDKFTLTTLLARTAERRQEAMIVYTATTRAAEEVARKLSALGFGARAYHGQMAADARSEVQELFLDDHIGIVVATKAFGMGIDKPDIRYVVHYDVPGDLESYMQESGRAGRDGEASYAVLLFHPRDIGIQEFFIQSMQLGPQQLQPLLRALHPRVRSSEPLDVATLAAELDQEDHILRVALYRLEQAGWLRRIGDIAIEASLTLLEDENTLRAADLPTDGRVALEALLTAERVPVLRRVTVNLPDLASQAGLSVEQVEALLVALAVRGLAAFRPFARGVRLAPGPAFGDPESVVEMDDPLVAGKRQKLDRMVGWARNRRACRRRQLLEYLGETNAADRCGGCDVCAPDLDVPWAHERMADVPNPSQLFDPVTVALGLIESNIARATDEERSPLGRGTLCSILLGNAFAVLQREPDPYRRKWKDKRMRSFAQWGLLATLPGRGEGINRVFDGLLREGLVEAVSTPVGDGFEYQVLRPTEAGRDRLAGA